MENRKHKLLYIAGDAAGCCLYRCQMPGMRLQQHGCFDVALNLRPNEDDITWADLIVFQRASSQEKVHWLEFIKFLGKKYIYDCDDLTFHTPLNNPFNREKQKWTIPNTKTFLANADLVTVTTEPLRQALFPYNKNIMILPNCIELPDIEPTIPSNGEHVRLGWVGSSYHYDDVVVAIHAVKEVLQRRKNVTFVAMGGVPEYVKEIIPADRLEEHPYVDLKDYYTYISGLRLDIGIAPLCLHPFNEAKSALRFLEYSIIKAVTVATDVWAFRNTITDGTTGFLVKKNKHNRWVSTLETLIDDAELRRCVAQNAYDLVRKEHNSATQWPLWEQTYLSVLNT